MKFEISFFDKTRTWKRSYTCCTEQQAIMMAKKAVVPYMEITEEKVYYSVNGSELGVFEPAHLLDEKIRNIC